MARGSTLGVMAVNMMVSFKKDLKMAKAYGKRTKTM